MFLTLRNIILQNRFTILVLLFCVFDTAYFFLLRTYTFSVTAMYYEVLSSLFIVLFFSILLQRIHAYQHTRSATTIANFSMTILFSFLSVMFIHYYGKSLISSDIVYEKFLSQAFYIRWFILFLVYLTTINQLWIQRNLVDQKKTIERLLEKERALTKAEMTNLQNQFHPHFLFNSLNSVSALVKSNPEKAREMLINLSSFYRISIDKSKQAFISLQEEIRYLDLYLSIEKVRFGNRLNYQIEMDPKCDDFKIPSLLLQPAIENAVKYGIYGNIGALTIEIIIECSEDFLQITITNPFDENAVQSSKGTGHGLKAISKKLELIYKRNDLLSTQKEESTFKTQISIPTHV